MAINWRVTAADIAYAKDKKTPIAIHLSQEALLYGLVVKRVLVNDIYSVANSGVVGKVGVVVGDGIIGVDPTEAEDRLIDIVGSIADEQAFSFKQEVFKSSV